MKKKINKICWGITLLVLGVILALNALDIAKIDVFFDGWWSLFIIVPSVIGLFTEQDKSGNLIGLIIGIVFLLAAQDVIQMSIVWKLIFPIVLVVIGVKICLDAFHANKKYVNVKSHKSIEKDYTSGTAVFSGWDMRPENEKFEGSALTAVFGGIECDLRKAIFEEDCVINATAVFGDVDIILPDTVNVEVNSFSLFGETTNKKRMNKEENTVTVYVNGTSIFGEVEIK